MIYDYDKLSAKILFLGIFATLAAQKYPKICPKRGLLRFTSHTYVYHVKGQQHAHLMTVYD